MPIISSGSNIESVRKYVLTEDLIIRDYDPQRLIIDPNESDRTIFLLFRRPRSIIIRNLNGNYKLYIKESQNSPDENSYELSTFNGVLQADFWFDGTDFEVTNYPGINYV